MFSGMAGALLSSGLLITSIILTTKTDDQNVKPVLVLDIVSWQRSMQQASVDKQKSKNIRPKLKAKTDEKKLIKQPVKHTASQKIETQTQESVQEQYKEESVVDYNIETNGISNNEQDAMPIPVPIFQLTETPRFIHKAKPIYPENMKAIGKSGLVKLTALIDKTGRVRKITIIKSAGVYFDQAAIEAIRRSIFLPAKINGQPVAVLLNVPVSFRLM